MLDLKRWIIINHSCLSDLVEPKPMKKAKIEEAKIEEAKVEKAKIEEAKIEEAKVTIFQVTPVNIIFILATGG